jgi:hypothetical protein
MQRILHFGRLIVLGLIVVAPIFSPDLTVRFRLMLNAGLLLVLLALLLISASSGYLRTLPGKLEALGTITLLLSLCLTVYLVRINGSEYLGVLVGGVLGLIYLSAMALCLAGGIWGLMNVHPPNSGNQ